MEVTQLVVAAQAANAVASNLSTEDGSQAAKFPSFEKNKTSICQALVDAGIETVTLNYDGWSDSGEITKITVVPDSLSLPEVEVDIDVLFDRYDDATESWVGRSVPKQLKLSDAIRYLVENATRQHGFHAWEDDRGSAGTLVLNARESSYKLSHCDDIEYNRRVKRSFQEFQG